MRKLPAVGSAVVAALVLGVAVLLGFRGREPSGPEGAPPVPSDARPVSPHPGPARTDLAPAPVPPPVPVGTGGGAAPEEALSRIVIERAGVGAPADASSANLRVRSADGAHLAERTVRIGETVELRLPRGIRAIGLAETATESGREELVRGGTTRIRLAVARRLLLTVETTPGVPRVGVLLLRSDRYGGMWSVVGASDAAGTFDLRFPVAADRWVLFDPELGLRSLPDFGVDGSTVRVREVWHPDRPATGHVLAVDGADRALPTRVEWRIPELGIRRDAAAPGVDPFVVSTSVEGTTSTLSVTSPGYRAKEVAIEGLVDGGRLRVALDRSVGTTIRVVDATNGVAVAGAEVRAVASGVSGATPVGGTLGGEDGIVVIEPPPSATNFWISAPGYRTRGFERGELESAGSEVRLSPASGTLRVESEETVRGKGSLGLRVRDARGAVVWETAVAVRSWPKEIPDVPGSECELAWRPDGDREVSRWRAPSVGITRLPAREGWFRTEIRVSGDVPVPFDAIAELDGSPGAAGSSRRLRFVDGVAEIWRGPATRIRLRSMWPAGVADVERALREADERIEWDPGVPVVDQGVQLVDAASGASVRGRISLSDGTAAFSDEIGASEARLRLPIGRRVALRGSADGYEESEVSVTTGGEGASPIRIALRGTASVRCTWDPSVASRIRLFVAPSSARRGDAPARHDLVGGEGRISVPATGAWVLWGEAGSYAIPFTAIPAGEGEKRVALALEAASTVEIELGDADDAACVVFGVPGVAKTPNGDWLSVPVIEWVLAPKAGTAPRILTISGVPAGPATAHVRSIAGARRLVPLELAPGATLRLAPR